jgi:hypothetical protein
VDERTWTFPAVTPDARERLELLVEVLGELGASPRVVSQTTFDPAQDFALATPSDQPGG